MAGNKTVATRASSAQFMKKIDNPQRRKDCEELAKLMREVTGKRGKMWGDSIVGFGQYHYKYESGREGDFFWTGFSPRKQNLAIYITPGFKNYGALMKKLGKHKHSVSCLYVNKLEDLDKGVLKKLIERSVKDIRKKYNA